MELESVPIEAPTNCSHGQPRGGVVHIPVAELAAGGVEALVNQLAVQLGKKAAGKQRPVVWMATTRDLMGTPMVELALTPFRSGAAQSMANLLGRTWQPRIGQMGDGTFSEHAVPLLARGDEKGTVYRLVNPRYGRVLVTGLSWWAGAFKQETRPVPQEGVETVKVRRSSVEIRYVAAAIQDGT
jgi:hypothetical protein